MSVLADQILSHLEQRALAEDVRLDRIDDFIASELGVPATGLHAYLLVCYSAERYARDRHVPVAAAAVAGGDRG